MRAVVQRVSSARVTVDKAVVGEINRGFLLLLGITHNDTAENARWIAEKIAGLRVFEDADGKMNLDLAEINGSVLVVSQFTLYGDCRKGRRPSFIDAARPEQAEPLYEAVINGFRALGIPTATGKFGAMMDVALVNDGPVTLIINTESHE
jgi:D-aminoacyl-tRNA deacylase